MVNRNAPDFLIEDATIRWRNFTGVEKKYNREGDRNFHAVLDREDLLALVPQLQEDGWNLTFDKRDPDEQEDGWEPRHPSIEVAVRYDKGKPPKIVVISSSGHVELKESTVEMLDWADIAKIDLIIHPSYWNVSGGEGLKGYLKTMFVTINEDELERKYAAMFMDEDDE
jgi:hypothetical protein